MTIKIIHGINVEYDENSNSVHTYLEHLENSLSAEEMRKFMNDAKNNPQSKTHLEDNHGDRITLEYKDDENCLIRKRLD